MHDAVEHMLEIIIGITLFALALIFLTSQKRELSSLIRIVQDDLIVRDTIYQQKHEQSFSKVSHTELYAITMGNREYPIVIDGDYIAPDRYDYEVLTSYIKRGYYDKHYDFNEDHEITSVRFLYREHDIS